MKCSFYIVRHGTTEWNKQLRIQGHQDSPLTEEGIKLAQERAESFLHLDFDAAFSSDITRAKRTAEIIVADRELAVITNKLLREQSFGRFEGKTVDEFRSELKEKIDERAKLTEDQWPTFRLHEEIETDDEIGSRFITFLRETAVAYVGKKVLVVSHGAMMRVLLIKLGFATYAQMQMKYSIENLGYFVLDSDGIDFEIKETEGIHIDKK